MFKTVAKLVINNQLDHDDNAALEHNNFEHIERWKCTNDDWCHNRNLRSKDSISA